MTPVIVGAAIAIGIGAAQAASSHKAVTIRWLRLGDLVALSVLGSAIVLLIFAEDIAAPAQRDAWILLSELSAGFAAHIVLVQLGRRAWQRVMIVATVAAASGMILAPSIVGAWTGSNGGVPQATTMAFGSIDGLYTAIKTRLSVACAILLVAGIMGGSLMTMLLGHAYLTASGEMTQRPFLRLTDCLIALLIVRAGLTTLGALIPWLAMDRERGGSFGASWETMMVVSRLAVGSAAPLGLAVMARRCVAIRSNQSATGILYVVVLLAAIGELTAMSLMRDTMLPF